jgi:hypothetical protein
MSVPERPSTIGKIEYEPDARRVVVGLISVLTYQPPEPDDAERAAAEPEPAAPPAPKQRKARPKPSRLAKWEASWQAEQGDEAQS